MGCTPPKKQETLIWKESPAGILKVTIIGVQINGQQKREKANLKIRISNQHFSTEHIPPIGEDKVGGDTFTFCINSFYKSEGRAIEVGYFSDESLVAFGAVDANPILERKGPQQFRLILNQGGSQHLFGFILIRAIFEVLPIYDLTFRFQEATIRGKSTLFGKDNVAVRLTIGQQIRSTEFQIDAPNAPPIWHDTKYNFKVPDGVKKGFIQLIDDRGQLIGSAELSMPEFYKVKEGDEIIQSQTLFFSEKQKQITAADLKYSFILGQQANFKPRTELFASAIRAIRPRNQFSESQVEQSSLK